MLDVGRIVRPHGLKGQVVVELWTNLTERMEPGARLAVDDGRELTIVKSSHTAGSGGWPRWVVTFEGVDGRDAAESLRDAVLRAEPVDVEGALWVHELVGAVLHDTSGKPLGQVEAVEANPASDLLVLGDGRMVPLTFVTEDGEGRLVVDGPPGLLDPLPGPGEA